MSDLFGFFTGAAKPDDLWIIIILAGAVTYLTRCGGHLILARFKNLHPRVEAALEAVPGAVMITLIVPPALASGPLEVFALIVAFITSLRLSPLWVIGIGLGVLIVGRQMGF